MTAAEDGEAGHDSETHVRAIARGLAVIEAMGEGAAAHTIAELAAATALPRSVVRRVLLTLCGLGYARGDGARYALTPRALKLGLSYLGSQPAWRHGQVALEDLRAETGESCSLAVLDGEEIVYLLRVPSRRILAMSLTVGSRLPAHAVSLGRVLLAHLDDEALEAYLERAAPPGPRRLRTQLRAVREQGYAWVDGVLDEAICGLAVPVRDAGGAVVAAVNVSTISGKMDEAQARKRLLVPLRHAAEQIRALGAGR